MTEPRDRARIEFGPFALDPAAGCLWRGTQAVPLRRKSWAVLCHLAARPQVLVSGDELLDAVWPGVAITPQTLTNVIRELRRALGESPRAPRYIETLRGRGYIFRAAAPPPPGAAAPAARLLVGRARELAQLHEAHAAARADGTRVVLLSGEPGIGKTTLTEAFLDAVAAAGSGRVARGVCVEQHGEGEPYLALLQAVDGLTAGRAGRAARTALRRYAPTWLLQLPWLLGAGEHERLTRALQQSPAARMLREGLAFFDAVAAASPLVLLLEDLQWADLATLDFLAALARRPRRGAALVLATFRRADAAAHAPPVSALARDLVAAGHATEIRLAPFTRAAVGAYLDARFGPLEGGAALVEPLEHQCAGNPLFLRSLVDRLVAGGAIARRGTRWQAGGGAAALLLELPPSLRDVVVRTVEGLGAAPRAIVEAAAVAGLAFTAAEIAPAAGVDAVEAEATCDALAGVGHLLRRADPTPAADAAAADGYAFVHAAYRRAVHETIAPLRRQQLHHALAVTLEQTCAGRHEPIAARLATHFACGGDPARAAHYYDLAAANAAGRFAYRESATYLLAALAQLERAGADTGAPAGILNWRLGMTLPLVDGYAAPESGAAFARARAIFTAIDGRPGAFLADAGLCRYALARSDLAAARQHAERLVEYTELAPLRAIACLWAGFTASSLGELDRARALLEEGLVAPALHTVTQHQEEHRVIASQLALVLTAAGEIALGRQHAAQALSRARTVGRSSELAHAWLLETERLVMLREARAARLANGALTALATENELVSFLALARFYGALLDDAGPIPPRLAAMREAVAARRRLGDRWQEPTLLVLIAETEARAGALRAALATLDEADAHVARTGERSALAELLRVRGACRGASGDQDEARRLLRRAVEVARDQGAHLLALRAAVSAVRLGAGERAELVARLAALPAAATCRDARDARTLLRERRPRRTRAPAICP